MTAFGRRHWPEPERRTGTAPNGLQYESVWDYPRPPAIRPEARPVTVTFNGTPIAASDRALRICETAGAPVIYLPPEDVVPGCLRPSGGHGSFCEWKGSAGYFDVLAGDEVIEQAAWSYANPSPGFETIAGYLSFYPALVECRLGDEVVRPQAGGFYGGWITDEITGPVKGEPGSQGW